ncbi:hypothetical protein K439DRAFT_1625005 [Ramaria rubella]|nr:hypothetical protein K439DRAFT_1625005 [Ramaria rubella]
MNNEGVQLPNIMDSDSDSDINISTTVVAANFRSHDASLAMQTFLWNSDHVHVSIPLKAIGNAVSFDGSFVSLKFEQLMASAQTQLGGDGSGDGTVPQAALEQHQLKLVSTS